MQNDDLEPWEYEALAEFRYQIRSFIHFSERAARDAGLSLQQHQLLLAVKGVHSGGHATIGYISERLRIRHHSAVELVNRLCNGGLIRRDRDSQDRRRVRITITRRGSTLLRKLALAHQDELQSVGPALIRTLQQLNADTQYEKHSFRAGAGRSR